MKCCENSKIPMILLAVLSISYFSANLVTAQEYDRDIEDGVVGRNDTELPSERKGKFALFSVVKFDNAACTTLTNSNGTCFTKYECLGFGGTSSGSCALGFGVCCFFSLGCSSTAVRNNTYFTGLSSLGTGAGFCQHTISKISSNVCQIRLDFDTFELAAPTIEGVCSTDKFIVTGASGSTPTICGSNPGQHIYVNTGTSLTPVTLTISTSGTYATRAWNIRSSQICCDSTSAAPEGCLQYYTAASGTLTSFNFKANNAGQHLAFQSYSICIRKQLGFCGICYNQCDTTVPNGAFSISGTAFTSLADSAAANNCMNDFVRIPCGQSSTTFATTCSNSKYCGGALNSVSGSASAGPVCTLVMPFTLGVFFDATDATTDKSAGFCLTYAQQAC